MKLSYPSHYLRGRLQSVLKFNHYMSGNSGFTLVEILVVFSVVAILSGIGITSLVSYGRSQQITQSSSDIKLIISQARFNALSAVKSGQNSQGASVSCGTDTLLGYSVSVFGNNSLDLNQECEGSPPTGMKRLVMPDNVSFGTGTTCSDIFFDSLTTKASGVPCVIVLEGYGQTKNISVDAIGNVSIN